MPSEWFGLRFRVLVCEGGFDSHEVYLGPAIMPSRDLGFLAQIRPTCDCDHFRHFIKRSNPKPETINVRLCPL